VIPVDCEGIVLAKLENPLRIENGLVESSPQAHPPEGIYIARTLARDSREVPVRVMNVNRHDQKFTKGSPLAHCEPLTLVTLPDRERPQTRDVSSKLQDLIEAARPHLDDGEFRELEELLAKYEDIYVVDSEDQGLDTVEGSAPSETEEVPTSAVRVRRAGTMRTPATIERQDDYDYIWIYWHVSSEPLGMSTLREGAVGERSPQESLKNEAVQCQCVN
jgi:hypothetical protein